MPRLRRAKYHLGASADREFDGTSSTFSAGVQPLAPRRSIPRCWARPAPSRTRGTTSDRSQVMAILMPTMLRSPAIVALSLRASTSPTWAATASAAPSIRGQQLDRPYLAPPTQRWGPYCTEITFKIRAGADPLHVNGERSRGRGPRLAHRDGIPPALQARHRHRHVLLSPARS